MALCKEHLKGSPLTFHKLWVTLMGTLRTFVEIDIPRKSVATQSEEFLVLIDALAIPIPAGEVACLVFDGASSMHHR
jgi:hypothetical protein